MFIDFFYLMRQRGVDVAPNEWMTLLEGMSKGLHRSSITGFYYLCRSIVVKNETWFDRFDQAFLEFFEGVPWNGDIPEELQQWLSEPMEDLMRDIERLKELGFSDKTLEELMKMLEERIKEQTEEHNGGNYWVGTQGTSPFGNRGWHPNGVRVGGVDMHKTAAAVAGERRFRDFRKDRVLDTRQFQTAFRLLKQMTVRSDTSEREFDVDRTIRETCDSGGTLKVQYKKPRKNSIKVLLLMDSGGSMEYYAGLCASLFQAAVKSNNFKVLQTYYFHNCIYWDLYSTPAMGRGGSVSTEWVLQNFDSSFKVIIVGDAEMHPDELMLRNYSWVRQSYGPSGMEWLSRFKGQFPSIIWLNPKPAPDLPDYWNQTHWQLAREFKMFHLSAAGLEAGMKELMKL